MKRPSEPKILIYLAYAFTALAVVAGLWMASLIFSNLESFDHANTTLLRQIKSGFGNLTAGTIGIFLSFAATLFLFVTFREQRRQFEENKFDTDKNRFEGTFFNLLSMLYQVRENVNREIASASGGKFHTLNDFYDGFKHFYAVETSRSEEGEEIEKYLSLPRLNSVENEQVENYLGQLYERYLKEESCSIGYYFRYIFNVINFVISQWENTGDSKASIHKYLNFLQAQMSNEELALIFYDVISRYGLDSNYRHSFKETIDTYGFLENISAEALADRRHHIVFPGTHFRFLNRTEKEAKS